ncbi:MAG TPA: glycosyltransferase [Gemmatimonadales bacterium]|jgi:GT2 family glycosyltransferase|nr:glycosyltransferase [Gemmatimonadales bacterium]
MIRSTAAVCTHARPAQLARALASLEAQRPPAHEILVVDNAPPDDATRALVAERFPGVRYVREPAQGLDFARNRALAAASGDVVAFLDDDAVACDGWLAALTAVFEADRSAAVCTGRVEPLGVGTEGERVFEANGGFSRGLRPIRLPADAAEPLHGRPAPLIAWAVSVGSGCSYAVRRTTALALGGFDEALDLGPSLPGGGDHDLLWRALRAGHTVVYEPAAVARHEHREAAEGVYAQVVGHQRALLAFLTKHVAAADGGRGPLAGYLAWRLLKPGVRLARRAVGRDPLPAPVLVRMWWNCWAGLTAYPRARRLARCRREGARA